MINIEDLGEAFVEQLNKFHTYPQPFDEPLDAWLHQSYANVIKRGKQVDWNKPYFSPSSSTDCPRALYHKLKKHKKDKKRLKPHQRRWQGIGTQAGDFIQREILLAERHMKKITGEEPRFVMGITDENTPAFEEFIFVQQPIEHNGEVFSLLGTSDGMLIDKETGEKVILEIKTKSDSPSKTKYTNLKSAEQSHINQVICYSLMYGTNTAIITYLNVSKKKWFEKDEVLAEFPDLRAFEINVTPSMQNEVLDKFAEITKRARLNDPPLPDLEKWRFSDYQEATINSLTDAEVAELEGFVSRYKKSGASMHTKRTVEAAFHDIKRRREKL